jgi:ABC-2 type transport system ATP-binding protein
VNSDTPALSLRNVSRAFEVGKVRIDALVDVSIEIGPGRISGLIGPDGAGKSTLMRLATGLLLPDQGEIRVWSTDLASDPLEVQSEVGYMPQRFGLYEDLSVQENLDLYADLQAVEPDLRRDRYEELMRMTALGPFASRLAGRLSGGMKQKLGLACTLVSTPRLLLLDEPTAGVDPISRRELWSIIERMVREQGMSVLLSTAYLDEAERCDEIILMHQGRVLGQGSPRHFSEPMRGRSFHFLAPPADRRRLQRRLSEAPDIVDVVMDNEKLRVVTRTGVTAEQAADFSDLGELRIEAVEPSFEDAFVAILKQAGVVEPTALNVKPRSIEADETVIEVDRVQKRFGDFFAVKGVSFSVRRGEIFGLLGANGAGKSTTFRMLCGLLPASSGELKVGGVDLRRAAAKARSGLGYMAQRFSLYVNLTVTENLSFFAASYGLSRKRRRQRIAWALETFELSEYADSDCAELPLGYRQRLALAAALLHEPDILFLDEPTSGVDPLARREFWLRINALAESGVTVLVTTHFMAEADYCDRLVIMADGELLAQGTPGELKLRFRSERLPSPSMEDAFIGLIQEREREEEAAA